MEIKRMLKIMSTWIIAVVMGIAVLVAYEVKSAACTEPVTATITRVESRTKTTRSSSGSRSRTKRVYRPYFEYTFGGRKYTGSGAEKTGYSSYSKGDHIDVRIDPAKPQRYIVPSDSSKELFAFLLIALGVIGAVATYFKEFKPSKDAKKEEDFYY